MVYLHVVGVGARFPGEISETILFIVLKPFTLHDWIVWNPENTSRLCCCSTYNFLVLLQHQYVLAPADGSTQCTGGASCTCALKHSISSGIILLHRTTTMTSCSAAKDTPAALSTLARWLLVLENSRRPVVLSRTVFMPPLHILLGAPSHF